MSETDEYNELLSIVGDIVDAGHMDQESLARLRAHLGALPLPTATPSPVAQAPAQAGEVANDFAAGWNINLCDTRPSEVASPTLADHSIVRAVLATQPLAAPVQAWEAKILGQWTATQHPEHLRSQGYEVREVATPPSQPVLAPVVREPLSDERIDQLFLDAHAEGYGMGWQECGRRFARAVIQATTGEQSHG